MANDSTVRGVLITFYSYKGGTGRSMALANTACLLARRLSGASERILIVDWDLEAPGLHRFFPISDEPKNKAKPGLLDYFCALRSALSADGRLYQEVARPSGRETLNRILPLDQYLIRDVVGGVDLIKAGRFDDQYPQLVTGFDWASFFNTFGKAFAAFREMVCADYTYCLVDSRTGHNDISGVCTMILPEKLVAVFTPNRQSLEGVLDIVERASQYRRESDDFRPLAIFPLPSRVELGEKELRERWRATYQSSFEELFRKLYELDLCDLTSYFDDVQLPHVSFYSYGENIAVLSERGEALSLGRSYESFVRRLVECEVAWKPFSGARADREVAERPAEGAKGKAYDVFLSHAMAHARFAEALAERLRRYGLRPYLPIWEVLPGVDWYHAIEGGISASGSVAVLIGEGGTSPWLEVEVSTALERAAQQPGVRVIPVLLPGAGEEGPAHMPPFLRRRNFVDLSGGVDDDAAFRKLVSGIKGAAVRPRVVVKFEEVERQTVSDAEARFTVNFGIEIDGRADTRTWVEITATLNREGGVTQLKVGVPRNYDGPFDNNEFEKAASRYFREVITAVGSFRRDTFAKAPQRISRESEAAFWAKP